MDLFFTSLELNEIDGLAIEMRGKGDRTPTREEVLRRCFHMVRRMYEQVGEDGYVRVKVR